MNKFVAPWSSLLPGFFTRGCSDIETILISFLNQHLRKKRKRKYFVASTLFIIRRLDDINQNNFVLTLNRVSEWPLQCSLSFIARINHDHDLPTTTYQFLAVVRLLFSDINAGIVALVMITSICGRINGIRQLGFYRRGTHFNKRPNPV